MTPGRLVALALTGLAVLRDYFQSCAADPSLPRFSADTRRVLEKLPASW